MATKKKETIKEKYPGASHSIGLLQDATGKKLIHSPSVLTVMKGQTDVERIHDLQKYLIELETQAGEFRLRALEYEKMNMVLEDEIRQRKISDTMLKNTLSPVSYTHL